MQQSDKRQCLCKVAAGLFFVACRYCVASQSRTLRNNMADFLSDEEMGKLIDLYQEEENLYNYRSRDYHDRDKARESLLRISRAMGKNINFHVSNLTFSHSRVTRSQGHKVTRSTDQLSKGHPYYVDNILTKK